jgi:hypothetical protein
VRKIEVIYLFLRDNQSNKNIQTMSYKNIIILVAFYYITSTRSQANIDACDLLEQECWRQCGQPLIFPFAESCRPSIDNGIAQCYTPSGCTCIIPPELRTNDAGTPTITHCEQRPCSRYYWPTLIPGSINWCQACGYDCDGNQANCITQNQFCLSNAGCGKLQMCSRWREERCRLGDFGGITCDEMEPTPRPTSKPTLSPTQRPTPNATPQPTPRPTPSITPYPTLFPTLRPTITSTPTAPPTKTPTHSPTKTPTQSPTKTTTDSPTQTPTESPTKTTTDSPTQTPTESPTKTTTDSPTQTPTHSPTTSLTQAPTQMPPFGTTMAPTQMPTPPPVSAQLEFSEVVALTLAIMLGLVILAAICILLLVSICSTRNRPSPQQQQVYPDVEHELSELDQVDSTRKYHDVDSGSDSEEEEFNKMTRVMRFKDRATKFWLNAGAQH